MSNTDLIIEERSRDIGDFLVGRLLPFREKRMVGPFIFVDHMGPSVIKPGNYLDIGQHPHIGLSTLTYLFEGQLEHRDTTGAQQVITPGSVNWMTSGKWVIHTERTPAALREKAESECLHGFQIWVALPKEMEDVEPSFHHIASKDIPSWNIDHVSYRLLAGSAFGRTSEVPVHSSLFLLELKVESTTEINLANEFEGEIGICVVDGSITACEYQVNKGSLLVSKEEKALSFIAHENTHLLLFGGKPFEEERYIKWNFVSSEKSKIDDAEIRWKTKAFSSLKGDQSYIDMP